MAKWNIADLASDIIDTFNEFVEQEVDDRVHDEIDFEKLRGQTANRLAADAALLRKTKSTILDTVGSELRLSFRAFIDENAQSTDKMVVALRKEGGTFIDTQVRRRPAAALPSGVQGDVAKALVALIGGQSAGMQYSDVTMSRGQTDRIIMPENMTHEEAIKWHERAINEESQTISVVEIIDAYPLDGANAFMHALKQRFGWTSLQPTGFWQVPPKMINVPTGYLESTQVAWGSVEIPGVDGKLTTSFYIEDGKRVKFVIRGEIKQRHKTLIAQIAQDTRDYVAKNSIYRGKAFSMNFPNLADPNFDPMMHAPTFIDTRWINPAGLIFPDKIAQLIDTTLFTPIRYTKLVREAGVPLKRGILLEGPPGVGKTLTMNVTAKHCEDNGWTYIYLQDVTRLPECLRFAQMYAPAVIAAEDIDRVDEKKTRNDATNQILNVIDGVELKNSEVIVVLTTNHVKDLRPEMLRPGRLDTVVSVKAPDAIAAARLVRLYGRGLIPADEDLSAVGEKLANQIPAVIREVVERSKLAACGRLGKDGERDVASLTLTSDDLEIAAAGMLDHLELLKPEVPDTRSDSEKAAGVVAEGIVTGMVGLATALSSNQNGHAVTR